MSTKFRLSQQQQQIEWRRAKIIELRARGLSQIEIARELQVSKQLISVDMKYLREEAKASIKEYLTEQLPEQYTVCLSALDTILRHAYEILQQARDGKEKLQALELFRTTHLEKIELLSNSITIDHALRYVQSKQQSQQQEEQQPQEGQQQEKQQQHHDDEEEAAVI